MADDIAIIDTSDGSHSLSSKQYNASYHSIHGAIEESMHIFISAGLYYKHRQGAKKLKIFEMGFGTGLNAYLTKVAAEKYNLEVEYHSIELHPVDLKLCKELNYHTCVQGASQDDFMELHALPWGSLHQLNEHFSLKKIEGNLHMTALTELYDLIYYDAFAPSSQADLWEQPIQSKLYSNLKQNGALLTYCAQGKFKRTLKSLGYQLDQLDGPGRKHEMTRAVKV